MRHLLIVGLLMIASAVFAQIAPNPPAPPPNPGMAPITARDGWCLTGNAVGELAARNKRAPGGCYTFHDAFTDSEFFPTQPGCWEKDFTAGWVPFEKGVLTDGKTRGATYLRWGHYWIGQNGIDIVIDLKKDYLIRRVDLECYAPDRLYLKHLDLFLKSPGEPRYTLVQTSWDAYDTTLETDPATGLPPGWPKYAYAFENVDTTARWVRIHYDRGGWFDMGEVHVWGEEAPAKPEPKKAVVIGKPVIAEPKELPFNLPDDCAAVYPIPQQIKLTGKDLLLSNRTEILYAPLNSARAKTTAEVLQDEIKRETGLELRVGPMRDGAVNAIAVSEAEKGALRSGPFTVSAAKPGPQGYALVVDARGADVAGSDAVGVFYGTQSLLQLLKKTPQGWVIRGAEILDWPVCPIRYIEGRRAVDENLIRTLARLKINYYHIYSLRDAARVAPLVPFAEKYCVKLTLPADPRFILSEHPECTELNPGEDGSKLERSRVNVCPSNPKTWEYYFGELDKWIDKFNSDYVSIGFDEMYQSASGARYNVCDLCRKRNLHSWEVLADELNLIARHFAEHGKKIYMLDTCFYGPSISNKEDTDKDWRKALDKIPNTILMGVWHPRQVNEILAQRNFPQIRWVNSPLGKKAEAFPKTTVENVNYVGMVINMLDGPFQYSRMIGLAQVCWSPNRYYPDDEIGGLAMDHVMPAVRRLMDNAVSPAAEADPARFFPVDLSAAANRSFTDAVPCDGKGWVDLGPNLDLRAIRPGRKTLDGIPFDVLDETKNGGNGCLMVQNWGLTDRTQPDRAEFAVGRKAASLVFLHAIEQRPGGSYLRKNEHAGYYLVCYEDGTYDRMDLKYDININPWLVGARDKDGNLPAMAAIKRGAAAWRGETRSGYIAGLYAAEWINPRPSQTITKVIVQAAWKMSPMSPILVACTGIAPRGDEADQKGTFRQVSDLAPAQPVGAPIDLAGGREESWTKYVAPDGTVLEGTPIERVETGYHPGTHPFVGSVAVALAGGNHYYEPKRGTTGTLEFTFPQTRALTGVLLHGPTRSERKIEDFGPAAFQCAVSVSEDGEKWTPVLLRTTFAEEQGPRFIAFPAGAVKKVRLSGNGFSLVRFYSKTER